MKKKILFIANVDHHITDFHLPYMKALQKRGWEVHVATSVYGEIPYTNKVYNIPIKRSPFKKENYEAYQQLKSIMLQHKYTIIHCHTPVGGLIGRLAARKFREGGTKVIYTAHGFHFYRGAPIKNWLLYYPIEKWLAKYTDTLITINTEDYDLAFIKRFKPGIIEFVHGVGVDTSKFKPMDWTEKQKAKEAFGFQSNDYLLCFAAEFNQNKNQQFLLHVIARIKDLIPNVKLLLAGDGPLLDYCKSLAKQLDIHNHVVFLGFRDDLEKIVPFCDVAVSSSLREGLPVNLLEGMASGLPIVATENRGHRELVMNHKNGWLTSLDDVTTFASKMVTLANHEDVRLKMGLKSLEMVGMYSVAKVKQELLTIYENSAANKSWREKDYVRSFL